MTVIYIKSAMSGLFPFKGTIRSFKRNRSLLTEEHLIALKEEPKVVLISNFVLADRLSCHREIYHIETKYFFYIQRCKLI